jgi:hypothetical protein
LGKIGLGLYPNFASPILLNQLVEVFLPSEKEKRLVGSNLVYGFNGKEKRKGGN